MFGYSHHYNRPAYLLTIKFADRCDEMQDCCMNSLKAEANCL
ncbi:hypothetical protein [Escherichia phage PHB10]|nr:hypothetical protein [Escherichia phage PHB10]